MVEKVFYQDPKVKVCSSKFVAGGKTYAMLNISSVSIGIIEASRKGAIIFLLLGLLLCIVDGTRSVGAIMVIGGIVWFAIKKDKYSVRINSNSEEVDGYISTDKKVIETIVNAINDVMIATGRHSPPATAITSNNVSDQLHKLAELKEKGHLTEEEFNKQKRKLIG